MKSFEDIIDEIIANMDKQRENARIKAFVTDISMMLRGNGVIPCMSEVSAEIDDDDALKTVFCCRLEKLDFSEHDKVFEDKIAEQKKDYKTASELLGKYQQENESLKKRIIELENFSCQAEQETESLVEKLKQRISELESMEMEKPTKLNLNDRVKVKLTPLGAEIYYHQCDDVNKKIKENGGTELEPMMPQIDKDGYTEFQLWHFMELYGEHIGMCKPNVISPLDIVVSE